MMHARTPTRVSMRAYREVNDLFVEARELIADALDSQGSTYFEDDLDVRRPHFISCGCVTVSMLCGVAMY